MIPPIGESVAVQGSGKNPYIITHKEGPNKPYLYCTCPAWRFIKAPIEERKCKHIIALMMGDVIGATSKTSSKTAKGKQTVPDVVLPSPGIVAGNNVCRTMALPVALANTYTSQDPSGKFMSEKLDGQRCLWDGTTLWSRTGNVIHAPKKLIAHLPTTIALDGELFLGREKFQELMTITRCKVPNEADWDKVRYMIFDAPLVNAPFAGRLKEIENKLVGCEWASILTQERCRDRAHVDAELDRISSLGGEGVMLRHPTNLYKDERSDDLLKYKKFHDAEACVIGKTDGTGRNQGRMGALVCKNDKGITFKVGTGFPDSMRDNPPPLGTKITYKYQEETRDGKPRFPSFLRFRTD